MNPGRFKRLSRGDRDCPLDTLVTAACGMRVARPVRMMWLAHVAEGFPLGQRARLVLGHHHLVGKSPEGSPQPPWEDSNTRSHETSADKEPTKRSKRGRIVTFVRRCLSVATTIASGTSRHTCSQGLHGAAPYHLPPLAQPCRRSHGKACLGFAAGHDDRIVVGTVAHFQQRLNLGLELVVHTLGEVLKRLHSTGEVIGHGHLP